ncbi:hypothetical protein BDV19DRAFT_334060 [Aspergillus venezuelensis]
MVDQPAAVCGVAAAFLTLSSIAVILRCYVRLRIVRAFGWDDGVMIFAMLFYAMFCGCMIGGSLWGTGRHLTELTAKQREVAMEYWFLCDVAYAVSSVLAKISVAIFLLRVVFLPAHRATLYSVTGLTVAAGIVFFVMLVAQCSPVSFWWTRMAGDTNGECGLVNAIAIMLYVFSVTSALFDLTVGLLPILLVRKLQMGRRTKIAVAGLLGMACVASIAIIIRIPYVHTIRNPDFLYATVEIAIWSAVEIGLSITAGSLATTRPLFRGLFSRADSRYTPFTNPNDPSNQNSNNNLNKYARRRSRMGFAPNARSKQSSRRTSERNGHHGFGYGQRQGHPLSAIDSGLGVSPFGRNSPISNPPSAQTQTTTSRGSGNLDKERNRAGGGAGTASPGQSFYEPDIGVQMMTTQNTVDIEGGVTDEFASAPFPAAGEDVLHMGFNRDSSDNGNGGGDIEGRMRAGIDTEGGEGGRGRSGPRIGVHHTFEISSSSTADQEGTSTGTGTGTGGASGGRSPGS